jgi:hypothetical protein
MRCDRVVLTGLRFSLRRDRVVVVDLRFSMNRKRVDWTIFAALNDP